MNMRTIQSLWSVILLHIFYIWEIKSWKYKLGKVGKGSNIRFLLTPNNFDLIPQCLVHPSLLKHTLQVSERGQKYRKKMVDVFLREELHPLRNDRDQLKCL